MEASPLPFYRLEFARRAENRREEDERRLHRERELKGRKDKNEREKRTDEQSDLTDAVLAFVLASESSIIELQAKVELYDAATVEALQINEEKLAEVQDQIRQMLEQAYVMPDGRRVFKTEDGLRVFDEHGEEVFDFDPEEIEDWRTRWEAFDEKRQLRNGLLEERRELHDYQDVIAETNEELEKEGLTEERREFLENRLEAEKPDAVKRVLGEETAPAIQPDLAPSQKPADWGVRIAPDMIPS